MSYQVFARKYRPKTFNDVLGQDHVVRTLRNAIDQKRLAHAYLFVGPRGTGKTSTARIFAKALNCSAGPRSDFDPEEDICREIAEGRSLDVLEIDGASNNGVEQVRDLRDMVGFAPARGQYRIFYIDEVHMLSTAAFNALLKTLEEPPAHVKFIFATTEAHKVLPTIISRCQRFDLRRIPDKIIADHLMHIASAEGVGLDSLAALSIAKGADGGMRDAQSMLDQLVAFCGNTIREEDVLHIFGFTALNTIAGLTTSLLQKQTHKALSRLHEQADSGKDLSKLLGDVIGHLRNLLVYKVDPQSQADAAPELLQTLTLQAPLTTSDRILGLIDHFAEVDGRMKWVPNKRLYLEVGLIKAVRLLEEVSLSDVISTLGGAMGFAESAPVPAAQSAPVASVAAPVAPSTPVAQTSAPAASASGHPGSSAVQSPPSGAPGGVGGGPGGGGVFFSPEVVDAAVPPAPPEAPVGLQNKDLWDAAVVELIEKKPMQGGFAKEAHFLSQRGQVVTIAFHPSSLMARESLTRPVARTAVEEVLSRLAQGPCTLQIEVSEEVAPPPKPEFPTTEALLAAQTAAMVAKAQAAEREAVQRADAANQAAAAALPPPPEPIPEEPVMDEESRKALEAEFYKDPAIQLALEEFSGQIISIESARKK